MAVKAALPIRHPSRAQASAFEHMQNMSHESIQCNIQCNIQCTATWSVSVCHSQICRFASRSGERTHPFPTDYVDPNACYASYQFLSKNAAHHQRPRHTHFLHSSTLWLYSAMRNGKCIFVNAFQSCKGCLDTTTNHKRSVHSANWGRGIRSPRALGLFFNWSLFDFNSSLLPIDQCRQKDKDLSNGRRQRG